MGVKVFSLFHILSVASFTGDAINQVLAFVEHIVLARKNVMVVVPMKQFFSVSLDKT